MRGQYEMDERETSSISYSSCSRRDDGSTVDVGPMIMYKEIITVTSKYSMRNLKSNTLSNIEKNMHVHGSINVLTKMRFQKFELNMNQYIMFLLHANIHRT